MLKKMSFVIRLDSFFLSFFLLRAAHEAYGSFQAKVESEL